MEQRFKNACIVKTNKVSILIEMLRKIGYETLSSHTYTTNTIVVLPNGVILPTLESNDLLYKIPEDIIDCGKDVNLFLTLAAMNDRNDYMQLFVNTKSGKQVICNKPQLGYYITIGELLKTDILFEVEFRNLTCFNVKDKIDSYIKQYFRKATKEEIIEYFSVNNY